MYDHFFFASIDVSERYSSYENRTSTETKESRKKCQFDHESAHKGGYEIVMLLQSCLPWRQSCLTCGHSCTDSGTVSWDQRALGPEVARLAWQTVIGSIGGGTDCLLRRKQPHRHTAEWDQLNTHSVRTCTNDVSERGRQLMALHVYSAAKCSERKEAGEWCTHKTCTYTRRHDHTQPTAFTITSTNRHMILREKDLINCDKTVKERKHNNDRLKALKLMTQVYKRTEWTSDAETDDSGLQTHKVCTWHDVAKK